MNQECRVDVSVGQKKCFTWNCQVKAKWHEGTLLGTKDESEIAVVTLHTESFLQEASAEFQKRILAMVC